MGVGVGEDVVVGLCVGYVRQGVTLLHFRVGEDPVQSPLQVVVLKNKRRKCGVRNNEVSNDKCVGGFFGTTNGKEMETG